MNRIVYYSEDFQNFNKFDKTKKEMTLSKEL